MMAATPESRLSIKMFNIHALLSGLNTSLLDAAWIFQVSIAVQGVLPRTGVVTGFTRTHQFDMLGDLVYKTQMFYILNSIRYWKDLCQVF